METIYSEALPSAEPLASLPHSPQQSASAPPPQEANNPIEMIPRIESKYFMLYNIMLRADAHV